MDEIRVLTADTAKPFQRNDEIWERYVQRANTDDGKMIDRWTQNIDILLVSSALFSAIITSFLLNATPALKSDTASVTNDILLVISQQLSSNNRTITIPAATQPRKPFVPKINDVYVCAMLFASLSLCIIASAGGLLAKLWLLGYRESIVKPGVAYERAFNRQKAFSALVAWRVGSIIEMLPNLVLLALILLFLALYASIVEINSIIASTIGVMFAAALTFGFATSFAAAFIPDCPFTTPFSVWLRFFMDYALPKDTLRYAGLLTCVCGAVGSGVIFLMTFVNISFTLALSLPGIIQIAVFRDLRSSEEGYPIIGLPLWVTLATATPVVLFSVAWCLNQFRFIYLGICLGIGIPWVLQGYFVAKNPGPLISDTVEAEALAWYLQGELSSSLQEYHRAALHANTSQRKIVLSNALFPVLASRTESNLTFLSSNDSNKASTNDVNSLVECMTLLSDFELGKASFWRNTAAVECPKGWQELIDLLDRIPEKREDASRLRQRLVSDDRQRQNDTSRAETIDKINETAAMLV